MSRKDTIIREDDWRAALEKAMNRSGDAGQTSMEIANSMNISQARARVLLSELLTEGKLVRGWRIAASLDGSMRRRPVYRIKKGKT